MGALSGSHSRISNFLTYEGFSALRTPPPNLARWEPDEHRPEERSKSIDFFAMFQIARREIFDGRVFVAYIAFARGSTLAGGVYG